MLPPINIMVVTLAASAQRHREVVSSTSGSWGRSSFATVGQEATDLLANNQITSPPPRPRPPGASSLRAKEEEEEVEEGEKEKGDQEEKEG